MPRFIMPFLFLITLSACTTVHEWGNGRVAVPRVVEVRSPFGTNAGFVMVEDCEGHVKVEEGLQPLFPETIYTDCHAMTGWVPTSSQGQGGQIVQGLLNGAGLVGLGALMPSTSVNASSNAMSSASSKSVSSSSATAFSPGSGHK